MDPIKPAEHISHDLSRSTIIAIATTGGLSALLMAMVLVWNIWSFQTERADRRVKEKKEEEEKEEERR